jgi:hypothetical protein
VTLLGPYPNLEVQREAFPEEEDKEGQEEEEDKEGQEEEDKEGQEEMDKEGLQEVDKYVREVSGVSDNVPSLVSRGLWSGWTQCGLPPEELAPLLRWLHRQGLRATVDPIQGMLRDQFRDGGTLLGLLQRLDRRTLPLPGHLTLTMT